MSCNEPGRKEKVHTELAVRAQRWLDKNFGMGKASAKTSNKFACTSYGCCRGPATIEIIKCERNPFKYRKYVEILAEKLYDNFDKVMQRNTRWLK